jgi:hypothetical protein
LGVSTTCPSRGASSSGGPGQLGERDGVEHHGAPGQLRQHRLEQRAHAVAQETRAHDDGRCALGRADDVVGARRGQRAALVGRQPEHHRLRQRDAEADRGVGDRGDLQPAGTDAQRGQPGEQHGSGGAGGAADDEHGAALVLAAALVGLGQRPGAQQLRGDRRDVSAGHRARPPPP